MPTNKKRVTITITGQLERDLEIVWTAYPNLRGNVLETILFILTMKASEILTGRATILKAPASVDEGIRDTPEDLGSAPGGESPDVNSEDEWRDA